MRDWFELLGRQIDPELRGRSNAPRHTIRELGATCRAYGVSDETRLLLATMASYPPPIRLAINLKTLAGLASRGLPVDILRDGLSSDEYVALAELDARGLPHAAREVAHGLFNIHERWRMLRALRASFRAADAAADEYLELRGGIDVKDNPDD